MSLLARTVARTVTTIAAEIAAAQDCPQRDSTDDVVSFVLEQIERMPAFLGWGVRAATVVFSVSGDMRAWTRSRFAPCRDLMRFYTSLAVLALYSRQP